VKQALSAIFALFVLTTSAYAQNGIRGQVVSVSAVKLGRIEVILEKSGAFFTRTFTDDLGNYRFDGLSDGTFAVVVKLDGYEPAHEEVYFSRSGGSTVNISLVPKAGNAPTENDADTVDIQELARKYSKKTVDEYEKALDDGRKGNTAKGIERLQAVIKSAADFQFAHNALGTLYQKANRFQDAENEYNVARKLDPRASEPLVNLGSLYIQIAEQAEAKRDTGLYQAAVESAARVLGDAIKLKPNSARAYYFLGAADYKAASFKKAEESLTRALELDRTMGSVHLMLANVYMKQQDWSKAVQQFDAYLKDNPNAADRDQIKDTRAKIASRIPK
jgi:tetratricopeptide (TPR) repeat protein